MPPLNLLLAFFVTTAVFAFVPGPAMLYAAARTMAGGRRAGFMAVLGIHLGCYVHIIAAAVGLSVLFHAIPAIYLAVKLAGAAYLIWLGCALFRAPVGGGGGAGPEPGSGRRAFAESVTVEVLNPKTALFFLAFLPQFVDGSAAFPLWLQLTILGAVTNAMFSLADIVCVVLAGLVVERLKRSGRVQRWIRRAGGTVLVGIGLDLALQRG